MYAPGAILAVSTRSVALVALAAMLGACGQSSANVGEASTSKGALSVDAEIPAPQGKPVLTIKGAISKSNSAEGVQLDLETIAEMPTVEARIFEPFLKTDVTFTGVMVDDLLATVGAEPEAKNIFMKALDDYSVDLAAADVSPSEAMLAFEEEGEPIKIRNGGPVRIVFLGEGAISANSDMWIWSVNRMTVQR